MVNQNIEGNISLNGRGHTKKTNQGYTPGEYNRLVNAEINDAGCLVNRRPMRLTGKDVFLGRRLDNPHSFIGNVGPTAITLTNEAVWMHEPARKATKLWNLNPEMLDGVGTNLYHVLKKVIRYEDTTYFISVRYDSGVQASYIQAKHITVPYDDYLDTANGGTVTAYQNLANYTNTVLIARSTIGGVQPIVFKDAFIHKDRLWIVTEDEIFFSKATDPLEFDPPDGGFFQFNDSVINTAIANRDFIYVIGNGSIDVITYTTDPNVDAQVRNLTGALGGDSACVYEDSVYTVRDDNLYHVSASGVTKVLDLKVGMSAIGGEYTKIEAFGPYIVFLRWGRKMYDAALGAAFIDYVLPHKTKAKTHPLGAANYWNGAAFDFKYHVYFLNMNTGAIHTLDFRDALDKATVGLQGIVSDMIIPPWEDGYNNFHLFFMTKQFKDTSLPGGAYTGSVYSMQVSIPTDDQNVNLLDDCVGGTDIGGGSYEYKASEPAVDVEIRHYVPDGNEFKLKKFRGIQLQGQFPVTTDVGNNGGLEVQFAFDQSAYGTAVPLTPSYNDQNMSINDPRRVDVSPARIPINQRARALSLRIKKKGNVIFDPNPNYRMGWSIEDIKILWGYTKRAPVNRSQDRYVS